MSGSAQIQLRLGDCVEEMAKMPADSVDAIVTDPPYGIHFMGKSWDKFGGPLGVDHNTTTERSGSMQAGKYDYSKNRAFQLQMFEWAREAFRVLKPGGYLLSFGGTRTYHRMVCAIEDAGFEIRDSLHWVYGSGFPKSLDVSKAIDKIGGKNISWFAPWLTAEREKRGMTMKELAEHFKTAPERINHGGCVSNWEQGLNVPTLAQFNKLCDVLDLPFERLEEVEREVVGSSKSGATAIWSTEGKMGDFDLTAPATEAAQQWQGWGTALKPAHEPICVARKPLSEKNVAQNVLKHGTGAINVDGCRVGYQGTADINAAQTGFNRGISTEGSHAGWQREAHAGSVSNLPNQSGRWPPNLLLSHVGGPNGCKPTGEVRRVKGSNGIRGRNALGIINDDGWKPSQEGMEIGYADPDGTEPQEVWECVESCPVRLLDEQSGELKSNGHGAVFQKGLGYQGGGGRFTSPVESSSGGASRFFPRFSEAGEAPFRYVAKSSRRERNAGLPEGMSNVHPTVKPIALMRWLVRLVCPPNGTVLDPFMGSGSTGCAAALEDFNFIGIEQDSDYAEIARRRIAYWSTPEHLRPKTSNAEVTEAPNPTDPTFTGRLF